MAKEKKNKKAKSPSQRARLCYLGLSVWIFLLIAATLKYLSHESNQSYNVEYAQKPRAHAPYDFLQTYNRGTRRIFNVCNDPENISYGTEGLLNSPKWQLKQVISLIRHGDRGPLTHLKNITAIDCTLDPKYYSRFLLHNYKQFVKDTVASGHVPWTQSGPFHGYPLLPTSKSCELGQLSEIGVSQLLNVGRILNDAYSQRLQLDNLTADDVTIYCTKLYRTFQSGMAFLYGVLPQDLLNKVTFKESNSVTFCFDDCACPAADHFTESVYKEAEERLQTHPAVLELVEESAKIIYEVPEKSLFQNPWILRDSLLMYICHDIPLPCTELKEEAKEPSLKCIKPDQVSSLLTYHDWEVQQQQTKSNFLKDARTLKAYGLVRNIVKQMLKYISEQKPKFLLYSGHDWTLQFLTTALGIKETQDITQYASRLVFEVYKNGDEGAEGHVTHQVTDFMFRFLINGRDVTKELPFCNGGSLLKLGYFMYGCKIESIVRYVHDDYFASLNATNFKDACHL